MLNISHVDHLNLNVSNLEKSILFYQEVFGFKIYEEGESSTGNPYKIIGSPSSLFLCLYESEKVQQARILNHIGIHILNDLEETLEELNKRGIPISYGDGIIDYPHSRSLYIADPDGNQIELSEVFGGGLGQVN